MTTMQLRSEPHGELSRIVIELDINSVSDDRDELLVQGVEDVISNLVNTTKTARVGVAVDIRLPDISSRGVDSAGNEAFVEACHGLVHAYVAEERNAIVPVNLVVSSRAQDVDRSTTLDYLASPNGAFTRGSLIDLREES